MQSVPLEHVLFAEVNEVVDSYRICNVCGVILPHNVLYFEHQRLTCKYCKSLQDKARRQQLKNKDVVLFKCKQMAESAYARVAAPSKQHAKCYQNLETPFGFKNTVEMKKYLYRNFYYNIKELLDKGEVPSVDRIDASIGYTKDNIRIISWKENTELGLSNRRRKVEMVKPNGNIVIFKSVVECVSYFGYKADNSNRASSWCKNDGKYKIPEGYSFKYIS